MRYLSIHAFKNARKALSQYILRPENKALAWRIWAQDFKKGLRPPLNECVGSAYVKSGVLHLRGRTMMHYAELKHPNIHAEISAAMKDYAKKRPLSEFDTLKGLKILPPHDLTKDRRTLTGFAKIPQDEKPFDELSKGEFKNSYKQGTAEFEKVERIRAAILKNADEKGILSAAVLENSQNSQKEA